MGVRDVVFTILAIDEASKVLEKTGLAAEESSTKFGALGKIGSKAFALFGVGAAAAAYEGVKMGAEFQSTMEQLATQAHVPQGQVDQLSQKVLDLAGSVGTAPGSLGEALYHIESSFASTGISGSTAMHLLQTSAEGAKVGHADLVDVTNALDAAVVSGIPGVKNFDQAMGMLNATVGAGDMHMQDLSEAFGTGAVAVVKGYGLSLRDVGAALAVFGDNNIRGANAGTALRMAVQSLAVPAKTGAKALEEIGLKENTLAKDMQKGGLSFAINDLKAHLKAAGISGKEAGDVITQAFGKKAGTGLNILVDQSDRLKSKYKELDKGAGEFGQAWGMQQKTLSQQWDEARATIDSLLIELGQKLMPILSATLGFILAHKQAVGDLLVVILGFGGALAMIGAYVKIVGLAKAAVNAWKDAQAALDVVMDMNPIMLVILAIAALVAIIYVAWTHSQTFRTIVLDVWNAVRGAVTDAVHWITQKWGELVSGLEALGHWFALLPGKIMDGIKALPGLLGGLIKSAVIGAAYWFGFGVGEIVKFAINLPGEIMNGIKALPGLVWSLITNLWNGARTLFMAGVHAVVNGAISLYHDLVSWFQRMVSDAIRFFSALPGKALAVVRQLPGLIKGAVSDAGSWLYNAGQNIISGLINGVKSMIGNAIGAVQDVGGSMLNGFKSALGISSPSKVFADLARWIPAGIAQGITQNMGGVHDALRGVVPPGGLTVPALTGPGAYGALAGSAQAPLVIHVHGVLDPQAAAREIKRVLATGAARGVTGRS